MPSSKGQTLGVVPVVPLDPVVTVVPLVPVDPVVPLVPVEPCPVVVLKQAFTVTFGLTGSPCL